MLVPGVDGTSWAWFLKYTLPNPRLHRTAQLAAKNHATSFASLASPPEIRFLNTIETCDTKIRKVIGKIGRLARRR